jgi:hypothetical protein
MLYSEQFSVFSYQLIEKASVGTQSITSAPKAKMMLYSLPEKRADSHG